MILITEEHGKRLPTVRIQKVVLKNFKSVKYGEIVLDCGKHDVPQGTCSDILGVYGQNGSGKTSLIEALSILKQLMIGSGIENTYAGCISAIARFAELEFTFDLQYDDGRRRKIVYSFKLKLLRRKNSEPKKPADSFEEIFDNMVDSDLKICVFDEQIQMSGDYYGEKTKLQTIIDTSTDDVKNPFVPVSKRKYLLGNETDEIIMNQSVNKKIARRSSKSFIFMDETLGTFKNLAKDSEYVEVLCELRLFARSYFYVVDTKIIGAISSNFALPLYNDDNGENGAYNLLSGMFFDDEDSFEKEEADKDWERVGMPTILPMVGPFVLGCDIYERTCRQFESANVVIDQLIPGMQISLKKLSDTITKTGKEGVVVELMTIRDGFEMPLRYESDGVKKIISVLDLIIKAYNQKSTTIAIDEFDSGIFEYLLGEILETFQDGGRGQFIFTSHNLRPLEVIDKKFLYFTTTNPENRYVRLKNIGKTNNLRNVYYREIVIGEQDEELYRSTQKFKIAAAFRKAGRLNG